MRPGAPSDISHWRLNKAIDFSFPADTLLAPGQRVTVVGFDPVGEPVKATEFRNIHGMNGGGKLTGPVLRRAG